MRKKANKIKVHYCMYALFTIENSYYLLKKN